MLIQHRDHCCVDPYSLFCINCSRDITSIPLRQCRTNEIPLPDMFNQWVNFKDIFNTHYQPRRRIAGMRDMLGKLGLLNADGSVPGTHHLGMDDVTNIARCVVCGVRDGAELAITRTRDGDSELPE